MAPRKGSVGYVTAWKNEQREAREQAERAARAQAQADEAEATNKRLAQSGLWLREHTNGNHTVWRAHACADLTIVVTVHGGPVMTVQYHDIVTTKEMEV